MAITQVFTEAVAAGDVRKIRIMMKDSLLVDLTFRDFDEMSRLAADVPGLYDTHDGKELVSDQSAWDDNYMDRQMVEVMWNFSRERLNHLKQVIRFLRPVQENPQPHSRDKWGDVPHSKGGDASCVKRPTRTDYWEQKKKDEQAGRIVKIVGGTVVGAVAGAVIGAVGTAVTGVSARGAVLLCTAAGAAVGGVATASAIKGDKA